MFSQYEICGTISHVVKVYNPMMCFLIPNMLPTKNSDYYNVPMLGLQISIVGVGMFTLEIS